MSAIDENEHIGYSMELHVRRPCGCVTKHAVHNHGMLPLNDASMDMAVKVSADSLAYWFKNRPHACPPKEQQQ